MVIRADVVARAERAAALVTAAVVEPLRRLACGLKPVATPLAGGHAVLLGPGMYVNRGLAVGLGVEITPLDLEALEALAREAGVPPEVEVTPWAHPSLLEVTASRDYRAVGFLSTLLSPLAAERPAATGIVAVDEVSDRDGLAVWQATAAAGFGYTTGEQRRVSDLFTLAIHRLDQTHLYVARMEGRTVGVASLTTADGVAILGGMTTLPSARGLGVQAELIRFRLAAARGAGCDLAMATAAPGSGSERNLLRSGFSIAYTTLTLRRP